jgi:hypothetical protein
LIMLYVANLAMTILEFVSAYNIDS